eukprot:TRINITY_DN2065_c0_g1_i7.p1 TRINITY_DN2065_c0_g1~~TRINITY_DN2065_c0_g1_i7.p1  ORF type:complete len:528 (-),score=135.97 TRINITY_DN2065_c0_g1_i7:339-1922(-)
MLLRYAWHWSISTPKTSCMGAYGLRTYFAVRFPLESVQVLMDNNGHVCLTDYWASKAEAQASGGLYSFAAGAAAYLAPEVLAKQGFTAAVDWWALGVLVCEMVGGVGATPFAASSDHEVFRNIMTMHTRRPKLPEVSAPLRSMLSAILVKDPVSRLGAAIKDQEWFQGIDWDLLAEYDRSQPRCEWPGPWIPTRDLYTDTLLEELREKQRQHDEYFKQDSFGQFEAFTSEFGEIPDPEQLEQIAALLVTPLLQSAASDEDARCLFGKAVDANSRFSVQGGEYDGTDGLIKFRKMFLSTFADADATVMEAVQVDDTASLLKEYHLRFEISTVHVPSGQALKIPGVAIAHLNGLCLVKGFLKYNLQGALEEALGKHSLDVSLVMDTWSMVLGDMDTSEENFEALGALIFARIFEVAPVTARVFAYDPNAPMSDLFRKHAIGVVKCIHEAVMGLFLGDSSTVLMLESIGSKHHKHDVRSQHFELVGEAFQWTVKHELDACGMWDLEAEHAWAQMWELVAVSMKKGHASGR